MALLEVKDLKTHFFTRQGVVQAVDGVTFTVDKGQTLGIVGESGCGKSVTALSIMGLIPKPPAKIVGGQVLFEGKDLAPLKDRELQNVRGRQIAMIFQDPMTSLNPTIKIGTQITETLRRHFDIPKEDARKRAIELLDEVRIPHAAERLDDYPHRFSGGMRQRVMIAIALSCNPKLLIADEPTTALDVTIQAQILELLDRLREDFDSAVILITHDLGVVAEVADDIIVMYAGRVVEHGPKRQVFYDPQHPYTWGLLGSIPRLDRPKPERLHSIEGTPPSLINLPRGCKFRPRCPHAFDKCQEEPELKNRVEDREHLDRCWLTVDDKRRLRGATIAGEARVA
jgi:oligopeptide/dipeptide ABC transporter ATP-binding protein